MDDASRSRTSGSLLARLRLAPTDEAAWTQFVQTYGRKIYGWCRRWNLQHADAEEVTQIVLLKLAEKMRGFVYDPSRSFRAWLKTLAQHAWSDYVAGRRHAAPGGGGHPRTDALAMVEARDDLVARLEEAFDQELLAEAMARVQLRVQPKTWEAFRLTAVEGLSGADAAAQLGMKITAVFKAKSNVQKRLQEEVRQLEDLALHERMSES